MSAQAEGTEVERDPPSLYPHDGRRGRSAGCRSRRVVSGLTRRWCPVQAAALNGRVHRRRAVSGRRPGPRRHLLRERRLATVTSASRADSSAVRGGEERGTMFRWMPDRGTIRRPIGPDTLAHVRCGRALCGGAALHLQAEFAMPPPGGCRLRDDRPMTAVAGGGTDRDRRAPCAGGRARRVFHAHRSRVSAEGEVAVGPSGRRRRQDCPAGNADGPVFAQLSAYP